MGGAAYRTLKKSVMFEVELKFPWSRAYPRSTIWGESAHTVGAVAKSEAKTTAN